MSECGERVLEDESVTEREMCRPSHILVCVCVCVCYGIYVYLYIYRERERERERERALQETYKRDS